MRASLAVFVAVALISGVALGRGLDAAGEARVGEPAPPFGLWSLDDEVVSLKKLLARDGQQRLVVSFFQTTCPPCIRELQEIADRRETLTAEGVGVLVIGVNETPEKLGPFVEQRGWPFEVVVDKFGSVARTYGAIVEQGGRETTRLPLTVVIAADGTVRGIFRGYNNKIVDKILSTR